MGYKKQLRATINFAEGQVKAKKEWGKIAKKCVLYFVKDRHCLHSQMTQRPVLLFATCRNNLIGLDMCQGIAKNIN